MKDDIKKELVNGQKEAHALRSFDNPGIPQVSMPTISAGNFPQPLEGALGYSGRQLKTKGIPALLSNGARLTKDSRSEHLEPKYIMSCQRKNVAMRPNRFSKPVRSCKPKSDILPLT